MQEVEPFANLIARHKTDWSCVCESMVKVEFIYRSLSNGTKKFVRPSSNHTQNQSKLRSKQLRKEAKNTQKRHHPMKKTVVVENWSRVCTVHNSIFPNNRED